MKKERRWLKSVLAASLDAQPALPWQRAPWASIHPGIITLRNRALGAAEQRFLDLIRAADQKAAEEARRRADAWSGAAVAALLRGRPGDALLALDSAAVANVKCGPSSAWP